MEVIDMSYKYKRINYKNSSDIKKAEQLISNGWKVILQGYDYLLLELSI